MKKEFTYIERKGLPGGPNEMFTYVTGVFSTEGYKRNSPDVNNPFNVIPSGNITMKDVDFPVMGTDNLGNSEIMMPGNDYQFPGDQVFEVPMAQAGIEMDSRTLLTTGLTSLVNPFAPLVSNLIQKGKENIAQNMIPVSYRDTHYAKQLFDGSSVKQATNFGKQVSSATNNKADYRPTYTANKQANRFGLPAINKTVSAMFNLPKSESQERKIKDLYENQSNIASLQEREDLLNILLGLDQEYNSISIQDEYKPSKSKDADSVYYKSPSTENYIINQLQKDPQKFINQIREYKDGVNYWVEDEQNKPDINTLGNYTLNIGKDDKGDYISYYDIWDLQPFESKAGTAALDAAQSLAGLNAPEVYGRVYLKDDANIDFKKEFKSVPIDKKKKEGGSVSWNWKGKSYSGTLIPSMETEKNRYARTKNGKIKTLPKAQSGKSIVPTSKFISNKESERLGLKKEIDYNELGNNFDNFDVIGGDELQTSSFNNQGVFTEGTTQDSLALYNNAMLSAKFYEQAIEDDGDGYQLRNTVEVGKNDVDEIFENFDPDMLNRGARFMDKAKPGRNKNQIGSSDDRNKFINKDLIQAGDFSYIGSDGATATFLYPDIAPPALLHRNIKPDKWKVYYSDKTADSFDNGTTYRHTEGYLLDIANVPAYDPVKVYPKSQGPVPKEAYKYSDIEEPKEFSRYVNIHGNNYGFNTKEEFIDIARRKNLPQGWIEANIPKDLESQTKESIAKLQTGGEYIVKSGDTFDGIANKVGVKRKDLELANPGARNKLLQLNQKLLVPSTSIKSKDVYSTVSKVPSDFLPEPELNIEACRKLKWKVNGKSSVNSYRFIWSEIF